MAQAHRLLGDPPDRNWPMGFAGLVRIVTGQQLSTASANAIFQRLQTLVHPLDSQTLLARDLAELRGVGLSASKIATLRAVAEAQANGQLHFDDLATESPAQVHERLTAIRGIGPWTADIYLMFCRGDDDAFAAGDLALQLGAQSLLGLADRPTAVELAAIAERWRPHRKIAAAMLWRYYEYNRSLGKATPRPRDR